MRQRRLDVAVPKIARQRDTKLELTDASCTASEQALALALLDLAGHNQLVAVQRDIDVFAPHSRELDLNDIGAIGLDDIGRAGGGVAEPF